MRAPPLPFSGAPASSAGKGEYPRFSASLQFSAGEENQFLVGAGIARPYTDSAVSGIVQLKIDFRVCGRDIISCGGDKIRDDPRTARSEIIPFYAPGGRKMPFSPRPGPYPIIAAVEKDTSYPFPQNAASAAFCAAFAAHRGGLHRKRMPRHSAAAGRRPAG